MNPKPRIVVSREDFDRLQRVIEQHGDGRIAALAEALDQELSRAELVPREELPRDVVTMNSTVVFRDEETGATRQVILCYPEEANRGDGHLSILSPIGSALLGLSVGQTIEWPVHGGGHRRLSILEVPSQSEPVASPA
jgi:regulator of nucleoside diphosphate kinase